jgi:hypothetical protein
MFVDHVPYLESRHSHLDTQRLGFTRASYNAARVSVYSGDMAESYTIWTFPEGAGMSALALQTPAFFECNVTRYM